MPVTAIAGSAPCRKCRRGETPRNRPPAPAVFSRRGRGDQDTTHVKTICDVSRNTAKGHTRRSQATRSRAFSYQPPANSIDDRPHEPAEKKQPAAIREGAVVEFGAQRQSGGHQRIGRRRRIDAFAHRKNHDPKTTRKTRSLKRQNVNPNGGTWRRAEVKRRRAEGAAQAPRTRLTYVSLRWIALPIR